MSKSIRAKKLLTLVLSFAFAISVFIGLATIDKKVSALDSQTTDAAVFNEAVYAKNISRPFWNSNIIYNETVLVTANADGSISGKLLYPAVDIVAVTNHDRTAFYDEGVHFSVSGNTITAINGALPHLHYTLTKGFSDGVTEQMWSDYSSGAGYYNNGGWQQPGMYDYGYCTQEGAIYTEGYLFRTHYIQVTYVYNPDSVDTSFLTKFDSNYLGGIRAKLEAGQDINMVTIGDSITAGCSSTGEMLNVPPYQPGYTTLVEQEIERVYGVNVNHVRLAVGGTMSDYLLAGGGGRNSFVNALSNNTFDLAIIAYGMNDQGAGRNKATYQSNIQATLNELMADSPNCNVIFVNTFPRNPAMDANSGRGTQLYHDYKSALDTISVNLNNSKGANVSRVVNMYAVGEYFMNTAGKPYAAISSSNCNHPCDSFIRVYAMNIMSTLANYDKVTVYEMNKNGDATTLFPFNRDLNGWNTLAMDYTNFPSEADKVWWQNRNNYATVATRRLGANPGTISYDSATQVSKFGIVWSGYNVNFNAYDVTKPIYIIYNVAPVGSDNFMTATQYSFNLHAKLEDALKSGHGLSGSDAAFGKTGIISLSGTNTNTGTSAWTQVNYANLYGKLRVNGNNSMVSDSFFPATYNTTTWDDQFHTVKIDIGANSTTVAVQGKLVGTLTNVTRANFPNGVAYLTANAGDGNTVFSFKNPADADKLSSSADGSAFTYAMDARGWSTYVQNPSVSYRDNMGETVVSGHFGIEAISDNNPYSGMTLLNNGYTMNFKPIDISKPFKLTYLAHPGRQGDFVFALFDNIKTGLKASNGTWDGASVGAKIWMQGANKTGLTMNGNDLYNHVLFNGTVYAGGNLFSSPDDAATFMSKPIEVIYNIGETETTLYVNNAFAGTLNVKRSDFINGEAYMSVACPSAGSTAALLVKAIENCSIPTSGGTDNTKQAIEIANVNYDPDTLPGVGYGNKVLVAVNFDTNSAVGDWWTLIPNASEYVSITTAAGEVVVPYRVESCGTSIAVNRMADKNSQYLINVGDTITFKAGFVIGDYEFKEDVHYCYQTAGAPFVKVNAPVVETQKQAITISSVRYDHNTYPVAGWYDKLLVAVNFNVNNVIPGEVDGGWEKIPNASNYVVITTYTGEVIPYLVEGYDTHIVINRQAIENGKYLIKVGDVLTIKAGWEIGNYEFKETVHYKYVSESTGFVKVAEPIPDAPVADGKLYSSADGSVFTYAADTNGWSDYTQTPSVSYANSLGETIISGHFGREGYWMHADYTGMSLLNNGYMVNYTALDVTKPIQIEYLVHPIRSGDYTFALFDDLMTAFKAGNGTWQGASSGAKIWARGANVNVAQNSFQLNNRLLFNSALHYNKDVFAANYSAETFLNKSVVVTYVIGETSTQVAVDGNYVGNINVKQSDFKNGVAYLTASNAWSSNGTFIALLVKAPKQDVNVNFTSGLTTASVTINSGLEFNMNAQVLSDVTEPQMTFTLNGETTTVTEYTVSGSKYTFKFTDITPQYMHKPITISLTAIKGGVRQVIDTKTMSIRDYAMQIINSASTLEAEKAVAVDLLAYGAMAQKYVNCDLDDLADKYLTQAQKDKGTSTSAKNAVSILSGTNAQGIKWTGARLILKDTVTIRYYIKLDPAIDPDRVTVKFNKGGVETTHGLLSTGSEYIVEFAGISPAEYGMAINARVLLDGVETGATNVYSVNSWIKNRIDSIEDGELAKSLYVYGEGTKNYVKTNTQLGDEEVRPDRVINTTSARNEIVTENHTISYSNQLWETPNSMRAPDFDKGNAQGYFLDTPIGNNSKFFAYVGIPAGASANNKVPGMVLVHGGGGTAFYEWVDFWVARGYAAIAMCTDANVPTVAGGTLSSMTNADHTDVTSYTYGGQTFNVGPDNGGLMNDYLLPIEQQWAYNAIAKVILSNSFLRSFEGVDGNNIGITGISYGSFLTCQAVGYDDRFACAIPVYGAYCQDIGDTIFSATAFGDETSEKNALYNNYKLLEGNDTPFLLVNGNVDTWFSILGQSMSNKLLENSKMLLINGLLHGHTVGAFDIPEITAFVDSICKDGTRLLTITSQPSIDSTTMLVSLPTGVSIKSATMYYTDSVALNDEAKWNAATCSISGNKITVPTVSGAYYYFINVTDSNNLTVTSQVVKTSEWTDELLTEYLRPYWASNTMFNETGAFIGETGSFNLLYTPTKVTMVGQYNDSTIVYQEGVDYVVNGNVVTRLAGSKMPYWVESEYFSDTPSNATMDSTMTNNPIPLQVQDVGINPLGAAYNGKFIPYCPDGAVNKPQSKFITVSYEHNDTFGVNFNSYVSNMSGLHNKLDNPGKDTIQILVVGDSVGEGCSSSGTRYAGYVGLDAPDAYDMVGQYISKHENKKVVVTNIALGGSVMKNWTKAGVGDNKDRFDVMINALRRTGAYNVYGVDKGEGVANDYYDLILVRIGGNDGATSEADYKAYYTEMLSYLFTYNPNANLVAISPFTHNELCPGWGYGSNVQYVEQWQKQVHASFMRGAQIGTADVWSATKWSLENRHKFGKDFLTNNINHANDFVNRWSAQLTLYAIYGDEYINSFN